MIRSRLGAQRPSVDGKLEKRHFLKPEDLTASFNWYERRRTKHGSGISPEDIPVPMVNPTSIENVFLPTKRIISSTKTLVGGFHASGIDTASSKLARAQPPLQHPAQERPHLK